jgi:hypothetical protein
MARRWQAIPCLALVSVLLTGEGQSRAVAAPTQWPLPLAVGSSGSAQSGSGPTTPPAPTAACVGGVGNTQVRLSWAGQPNATSYTVYQSTQSATGPFTAQATVTGSPWLSGSLGIGTYWFAITANTGSNWQSVRSAPSAQRTVAAVTCL